jgi:hypothetical protein
MTHIAKARRLLAVVGMTAVMSLAAACGSGSTPPATTGASGASSASSVASSAASEGSTEAAGDYCAVLASGQKELEGLSGTLSDSAALEKGLSVVRKIEAAAPPEVKGAWGDFIAFVESASSGNTSAMADAMAKMEAAGAKIEAHAKSSCNLNLS